MKPGDLRGFLVLLLKCMKAITAGTVSCEKVIDLFNY